MIVAVVKIYLIFDFKSRMSSFICGGEQHEAHKHHGSDHGTYTKPNSKVQRKLESAVVIVDKENG